MKGCLYPLAGVVGLGILMAGSPASAWLASGLTLTVWLKRRKNKWTESAVKSFEPFLWALAALTLMQWFYNGIKIEDHINVVTNIERFIVRASFLVPRWTKLGWKEFVLIVGALSLVSLAAPRAALVTRFVRGSKVVSRIDSVLTALASFTFFGGVIAQSALNDVYEKIQLQLRATRDKITEENVR